MAKFKKGDTVFFMQSNLINKSTIDHIASQNDLFSESISYEYTVKGGKDGWFQEKELFSSLEGIMKYLKNSIRIN